MIKMAARKKTQKRKVPKLLLVIIIAIILALVALMVLRSAFPGLFSTKYTAQRFPQLGTICELATLKCYYHNVAKYEAGVDDWVPFNYGKLWLEYGGTVRIGVDASQVSVSTPDENDVLEVTIPRAKVLDIDFDEESINKLSEKRIFSKVSSKTELEAFAEAQENMYETAVENQYMLAEGQSRAKEVIERYILQCGKNIGKEYTVTWKEIDE